jgi:hypothetical protein
MREQIYALCSPDGAILDEAVLGVAKQTGIPLRGIAFHTKEISPVSRKDLAANRDLGAQVRAVTYEQATEVLERTGRIPPPRVAINGHIFYSRDALMKEVFADATGLSLETVEKVLGAPDEKE